MGPLQQAGRAHIGAGSEHEPHSGQLPIDIPHPRQGITEASIVAPARPEMQTTQQSQTGSESCARPAAPPAAQAPSQAVDTAAAKSSAAAAEASASVYL